MVERGLRSGRCCCCFPIRGGTGVLGVVELVLAGLAITGRVFFLLNYDSTLSALKEGPVYVSAVMGDENVDWWVGVGQLVLNGVQVVCIVLLLVGVAAAIPSLLIPHIVIQVLGSVGCVGQAVVVILAYGLTPYTLGQGLIYLLFLLLSLYFVYVSWLCYKYLHLLHSTHPSPNGYVTRDVTHAEMTNL